MFCNFGVLVVLVAGLTLVGCLGLPFGVCWTFYLLLFGIVLWVERRLYASCGVGIIRNYRFWVSWFVGFFRTCCFEVFGLCACEFDVLGFLGLRLLWAGVLLVTSVSLITVVMNCGFEFCWWDLDWWFTCGFAVLNFILLVLLVFWCFAFAYVVVCCLFVLVDLLICLLSVGVFV